MKAFIKILIMVAMLCLMGTATLQGIPNFTIVDTWDLGNRITGAPVHLGGDRYLSILIHSIDIYEITTTSAERVQSIPSAKIICMWYPISIDANRAYIATQNEGILVFNILPDYSLEYVGEIPLAQGLGAVNENMLVWVSGNTMVVSTYSMALEDSEPLGSYIDVYDITNLQAPVLLARHLFPSLNALTKIIPVDGGYYLIGIFDDVFFSPDLVTFDAVNLIPDYSSIRMIRGSFLYMGKLHVMKQGSSMILSRYSILGDHGLSLDWELALPGMMLGYEHHLEQDRVFINGYDSNLNYVLCTLVPSEGAWTLGTMMPFIGTKMFQLDTGYLGFGYSAAAYYDHDLNLQYTIFEDRSFKAITMIANRWMGIVEDGPFGGQPLYFYDLENRQWLDYFTTKEVFLCSNRQDSNVLCIPNEYSAQLLRFMDDGTCQPTTFAMSNRCFGMDVWEDRMAITHVSGNQFVLKVYDISSGVPVLLASRPLGTEITRDMLFYGPDHIVVSKNMYLNPELLFFKIEPEGMISSLTTLEVESYQYLLVHDDTIVTGRVEGAVIDISDPDLPYIRSYTDLMRSSAWGSGYISADGENGYLFTDEMLWISYLTDANFQVKDWFYSSYSWYRAPNRIILQNRNSFLEVEHAPYTSIDDPAIPQVTNLLGLPYPNPFGDWVKIDFELKEGGLGKASVYNVRGQKVRSLDPKHYPKGKHTLEWDGCDDKGKKVSAGVYLMRLETQGRSYVRRMIRMR